MGTSRASKNLMLGYYKRNNLAERKPTGLNTEALKHKTQQNVPNNVILETTAQKNARLNKAFARNSRNNFAVTGKGGNATSSR